MQRILLLTIAALLIAATPLLANPLDGGKTISLDLKGVPLSSVLTSIAQQNNLNIVFSQDIKGQVTLRLDSVSLAKLQVQSLLPQRLPHPDFNRIKIRPATPIIRVGAERRGLARLPTRYRERPGAH